MNVYVYKTVICVNNGVKTWLKNHGVLMWELWWMKQKEKTLTAIYKRVKYIFCADKTLWRDIILAWPKIITITNKSICTIVPVGKETRFWHRLALNVRGQMTVVCVIKMIVTRKSSRKRETIRNKEQYLFVLDTNNMLKGGWILWLIRY